MDFISSFLVIIVLVLIITFGSIIYFISLILKRVFVGIKSEKNEKKILIIADTIYNYMENKDIKNTEEILKHIKAPKKMKIVNENNEVIIYYENLTYNLNKGRFIRTDV